MSEAKHTPGPWGFDLGRIIAGPFNEALLPYTVVVATINELPKAGANRALIASAPELLEACKALLKSVEDWNQCIEKIVGRAPQTGTENALELCRAAIAKAEGRLKERSENPL